MLGSRIARQLNGSGPGPAATVAGGAAGSSPSPVVTAAPVTSTSPPPPAMSPSASASPTTVPTPRATPVPTPLVHVVQRGETLTSIAQRYGVTVADLAAANRIKDPNLIVVGQRLTIPGG